MDWSIWIKVIGLIIQYGPKVAAAIKGHANGIAWVQWVLNTFEGESLAMDGILGPLTEAAVRRAQAKLGIPVDGIPGLLTQLALGALARL